MTGIRIILIKFADKNQTRDEKYQNPTHDPSEYDGVKHTCPDACKGVSKELADHRKVNISNVVYDLTFNIPSNLSHKVTGTAIISFELKEQEDLILDFQGEFNGTAHVYYGKKNKRRSFEALYEDEHIIIPMKQLQAGKNKIEI